MVDTNNVQELANTTQAMYTLFAKCNELLGLVSQSPSLGDIEALRMCLDEWIERYKDKLANPTTSQGTPTQRFEDSQAQDDGYDSDVTTNGELLPMSSSFRPVQLPSGETRDTESPWSPSFI